MKYLMIVCFDPTVDPADAPAAWTSTPGSRRWTAGACAWRGGALERSDATTVRVRGGETLISDGPFAETKEFMVGYDMLDCKDLDEAIEVASKHPLARRGAMELRPFGED